MKAQKNYYLIYVQYLGFRYSGWQKQPGQRTLESMVEKTLRFILPERNFKVLAAGRTDAKVSALETAFELFLEGLPLVDDTAFLEKLNTNLPPDIKALSIETVSSDFNIIRSPRVKTYAYLFSHGQKNHPTPPHSWPIVSRSWISPLCRRPRPISWVRTILKTIRLDCVPTQRRCAR